MFLHPPLLESIVLFFFYHFSALFQLSQTSAQSLSHMFLLLLPSAGIEEETGILEANMGKAGSVALPKAICQADSHCDIYIVIPLLIALDIFIEGTQKACWGRNLWIYDRQSSPWTLFLITGKYIGTACRVVKFKAKTNACWERSIWKKVYESIAHFPSTLPLRNCLCLY